MCTYYYMLPTGTTVTACVYIVTMCLLYTETADVMTMLFLGVMLFVGVLSTSTPCPVASPALVVSLLPCSTLVMVIVAA